MKIDFQVDDMDSIAEHISDKLDDKNILPGDIKIVGAENKGGDVILKLNITGLSKEEEAVLKKAYGAKDEDVTVDAAVNKLLEGKKE